ncbi:MAG: tRNA (guanosine(46)-N7)-methyltransferase TrmB [Planctomycetales bacterium]|nr:tRNA (guanosine(46)-N7)-methyltransferase TrmB [Planctomycetales bacterium]
MNQSPFSANHLANPRKRAIDLFENPLSWMEISQDRSDVELEIGSGKGLFLQTSSLQRPDVFFIGIELAAKFANRAADRLHRHNCMNVCMLRGDAKKFLQETVPDRTLLRVHCYFPDPWWRNKHKKRRVLNEQTLSDIERTLRSGGEFHFWTDVLDYYEHIGVETMKQTQLLGPYYVPQKQASHPMDYTTHFERRARINHQAVYRAIFVKQ